MLEQTRPGHQIGTGGKQHVGRMGACLSPCPVRVPLQVEGPHWLVAGCGRLLYLPVSLLRQAERLLELLTTEILHPDSQAPSGVKSHFLEIFLEELSKVGATEVRAAGRGWRPSPSPVLRHEGLRPRLSLLVADGGPEPQVHRALLHDRRSD